MYVARRVNICSGQNLPQNEKKNEKKNPIIEMEAGLVYHFLFMSRQKWFIFSWDISTKGPSWMATRLQYAQESNCKPQDHPFETRSGLNHWVSRLGKETYLEMILRFQETLLWHPRQSWGTSPFWWLPESDTATRTGIMHQFSRE